MPGSRTGGTTYLNNRARVIAQARADGLTHCPGYTDPAGTAHPCGRTLNYDTLQQPDSAEADHIIEARYGGSDDVENLRVICRTCNQQRNRRTPQIPDVTDFPTLGQYPPDPQQPR